MNNNKKALMHTKGYYIVLFNNTTFGNTSDVDCIDLLRPFSASPNDLDRLEEKEKTFSPSVTGYRTESRPIALAVFENLGILAKSFFTQLCVNDDIAM
jgi:hypothetical protein